MRTVAPALVLTLGLPTPARAQEASRETPAAVMGDAEFDELMADVQARIDAMDEAAAARDESLKFLTDQVEKAMHSFTGQREQVSSLQQKNVELSTEKDFLSKSRAELDAELARVTSERDDVLAAFELKAAETAELLALEKQTTAGLAEKVDHLSLELGAAGQKNATLERELAEARQVMVTGQEIMAGQKEESAHLERQLGTLREQLAKVADALETSETRAAGQEEKIADLGRRLNLALVNKVAVLARYRAAFFDRLREELGGYPGVRIVGDRFVFQSEALFETATADLGTAGKEQMVRLAGTLKDFSAEIPEDIDWVLRIDGHTDRRPFDGSKFPSNWELSTAQAVSVVKFLIGRGLPAEHLAAAGFGEYHPLDPTDDEIAHRRNRRIEFKVTLK